MVYYPRSPALSTGHPEMWDREPANLEAAVRGSLMNPPPKLWIARLVPRGLSGWLARRLRRGGKAVTCQVRTVSSVIEAHDVERLDLLKIDCEGAELDVLHGIREAHWPRIQQVVMEVHDEDGRLDEAKGILARAGFTHLVVDVEPGFEETPLRNIFARR